MSSKDRVARAVQDRRNDLGLSQAALAELAGLSRGTIRNIESGIVEPNAQTWRSLEPLLGWARGSLDRLGEGLKPVQTLPADVLGRLIIAVQATQGAIDNDPFSNSSRPVVRDFRDVMATANEEGVFPSESLIALTDLVYALFLEDDLTQTEFDEAAQEELIGNIEDAVKIRQEAAHRTDDRTQPLGSPTRHVKASSFSAGDRVRHPRFGVGTIRDIYSPQESKGMPHASIEFGRGVGTKQFVLKYASLERVDEEVAQLPDEVEAMIGENQILDYGEFTPPGTEKIKVVALLVKSDGGPLSSGDRRYIGTNWNDLSIVFEAINDGKDLRQPVQQEAPTDEELAERASYDEPPF